MLPKNDKGSESSATDQHWQLTRRNFVRFSAVAVAVLSQGLMQACAEPEPIKKEPPLPTCKAASTDEEKAIEAFCEVVIPGKATDPKGTPGAVEACAVPLFFDEELPAASLVSLIVLMLDSSARAVNKEKKKFVDLADDEKIKAVEKGEETLPEFSFAIQLVRLAYYSSEVAAYQLGYPGANDGYINHPHFTFGAAVSKELTPNGNLP